MKMERRVDFTYLRLITWAKAISAVVLSIGVSVVLIFWGISFIWKYTPPELKIANPEVVLKAEPLAVTQDKPFTVTQDKPFELERPAPFKLEQLEPFKVEQPEFRSPVGPAATKDGSVITREVTVFNQVRHSAGFVDTGWKFKDGGGREPLQQYCYYQVRGPRERVPGVGRVDRGSQKP
jgi:hypothetical protein